LSLTGILIVAGRRQTYTNIIGAVYTNITVTVYASSKVEDETK